MVNIKASIKRLKKNTTCIPEIIYVYILFSFIELQTTTSKMLQIK
jgi:hypothetical protein